MLSWYHPSRAAYSSVIGAHSVPRNPRICFFNSHGSRHSDIGDFDRMDSGSRQLSPLEALPPALLASSPPSNKPVNRALSERLSVSKSVPSMSNNIALTVLVVAVLFFLGGGGSVEEESLWLLLLLSAVVVAAMVR